MARPFGQERMSGPLAVENLSKSHTGEDGSPAGRCGAMKQRTAIAMGTNTSMIRLNHHLGRRGMPLTAGIPSAA